MKNQIMTMEPQSLRSPLLPWLGAAVLGASLIPAMGYFQPASMAAVVVFLIVGALLLSGAVTRAVGKGEMGVAALLMLPMLWFVPGIDKIAPAMLIVGSAALAVGPPVRWARGLMGAILAAGAILLAQSLALQGYASFTARSHELPLGVARLLGWIAHLLGGDMAVAANTPGGGGGVEIVLRTMRKNHHLGATWELLIDPVTLGFVTGGAVLVLMRLWNARQMSVLRAAGSLGLLALCVVAWLPIRAGVLIALIWHRALRTDFDAPLKVMDVFYSPWALLLLVLPLALLAWRVVRIGDGEAEPALDEARARRFHWMELLPPALAAAAVAMFTYAVFYDATGTRKMAARVMVDEYHTHWEPTQIPFDTKVYGHDSGYNYAAIYDYTSRFYKVSRLLGPGNIDEGLPRKTITPPASQPTGPAITDDVLKQCDVYIVKCPTARFYQSEIECLKRFVDGGGGLLLIGEHTDVFGLGTNINDIARLFGFQFRYDILFNIDEEHPFDYLYNKPLVPHPIVQWMPPLDFEGPCTIVPSGPGRAVMLALGQREEPAYYYASNFMPPPEDRADARYGAWVVMWATKYGKGRVVAHADSTQWSNFSAFEKGKPESWIGMIEWLNHSNSKSGESRPVLVMLGIVMLLLALAGLAVPSMRNARGGMWLMMIGAGMTAFVISAAHIRAANDRDMPVPPRSDPNQEMINVGIDRAISEAVISKGGFIGGLANGYGIFERWILRLGWFTERGEEDLLSPGKQKDLVVYLLPGKDVSDRYRQKLMDYVKNGGRILVIDTPENPHSTANSLLKPFGMELTRPYTPITGPITSTLGLPTVTTPNIFEVTGAQEVLSIASGKCVAGTLRYGKGTVTAIGYGARFSDTNFGVTGDVNPGPELLQLYDVEYGVLRHLMGKPVHEPSTQPTTRQVAGGK